MAVEIGYAVRCILRLFGAGARVALLAACVQFIAALQAGEAGLEELISVQARVQSSLEHARETVVAIECNGGTASGVIVSPSGLVLTAAHVTGQVNKKIKIILASGRTVEAKSLGIDTATDAAMVQLPAPAKAWPYADISRDVRSLKAGDWCFDLAHPGGHDKARGSVVRVGRIVKVSANMLQSDCVLMGGDSGGPLFNLAGEVIGVNSQIWRGRDQNMHVSMAPFLRSWDELKKGSVIKAWAQGAGGWMGVSTEAVDGGLRIAAIAPDSPALKAGLKEGDVILSLNKQALTMPSDFSDAVKNRSVGELVTLKVKGTSGERAVEVKLGRKPDE
jgi:serine protease Do